MTAKKGGRSPPEGEGDRTEERQTEESESRSEKTKPQERKARRGNRRARGRGERARTANNPATATTRTSPISKRGPRQPPGAGRGARARRSKITHKSTSESKATTGRAARRAGKAERVRESPSGARRGMQRVKPARRGSESDPRSEGSRTTIRDTAGGERRGREGSPIPGLLARRERGKAETEVGRVQTCNKVRKKKKRKRGGVRTE
ncbi:hypothetical protein ES703_44032 [subsurface metagenome]